METSSGVRPGSSKCSGCVARRAKSILVLTMTESQTQAKAGFGAGIARVALRLAVLIAAGLLIGTLLTRAEAALERRHEPAGFAHGVVQGALMPIALPNLALGRDVPIYAANNTGRVYKLGYTMGVNGCGL